jgi:hypothetical protein
MNKGLANFISVLAHPVFINLLCLYLLFQLNPPLSHGMPERIQWFYITFIFISTSIIPLVLVVTMRLIGNIKSLTLRSKEERHLPYLITFSLYIFNYYNFFRTPTTHPLILGYLIACGAIVLGVLIINYFNKISIHMATLGAFCGMIAMIGFIGFLDLRGLLLGVIIFSGLVGSARVSLQAHYPQQIYSGFVLGFAFMFIILNLSYYNF